VVVVTVWVLGGIVTVTPDNPVARTGPLRADRLLETGRHLTWIPFERTLAINPVTRRLTVPWRTPEGALFELWLDVDLNLTTRGALELLNRGNGTDPVQRIDDAIVLTATELIRQRMGDAILPVVDVGMQSVLASTLERYGALGAPPSLSYRDDAPATHAMLRAEAQSKIAEACRDTGQRILVVGLDGADWQTADPLIARGKLPHLARLRERGAWGNVKALTPILSPLLWTSVATGVRADRHGILDFLIRDPSTGTTFPVSSRFRRVRALWNLFSEQGRTSDVVAWWATWPAEPINGHLVSDRVAYSLFDFELPTDEGATYPSDYMDRIRPLLVGDDAVSYDEVARFVDVTPDEFSRARRRIERNRRAAYREPLNHLTKVIASTRSYHGVALNLLENHRADLTLVYYQGIDEVAHRFMHFMPPAMPGIDPDDVRRLGPALERFYVYQDELLGELIEAAGPETTILVVADHGFLNGAERPRGQTADIEGQPGRWHRPYGVFVLAGPRIRSTQLDTTSLLDIAPTLLHLAGLPVPDDGQGRVVEEAFDDAFLAEFPVRTVPTYEITPFRVAAAPRSATLSAAEAEIVENLRALGYVGSTGGSDEVLPEPDRRAADDGDTFEGDADTTTVTGRVNLAAVLMASGDLDGAEREIQAALARQPNFVVAQRQFFTLRMRQERIDDALAIARDLLPRGGHDERFLARVAEAYRAAGRIDEGLRVFSSAVEAGAWTLGAPLARLLLESGNPDAADAAARAVLARDPRSESAMVTVFRVARSRGRLAGIEPLLREALDLNPRSVMHLNWLAIAVESRGDASRAEALLQRALDANPDHGGSMANLGAFYSRRGDGDLAIALLERALRIDPSNLDARINVGSALARAGRIDEAIVEFEYLAERDQGGTAVLNALARATAQRGELAAAQRWLRRSLETDPAQDDVRASLERMLDARR
jgi:predicted AlkP superfamily phosphohydrolase/phosphomutase/tetratricopeptide (TPR) repeat protein